MVPKRHMTVQSIKDKDSAILYEPVKIVERRAQYVEEELCNDNRDLYSNDVSFNSEDIGVVSEMEVKDVIQKLTRNKATGADNIPAEFLQTLGDKGIKVMTRLMNNIYKSGNIPDDFLQTVLLHYQRLTKRKIAVTFKQ